MVLAPEHPLVGTITVDKYRKDVKSYQAQAATKSDFDRIELNTEKTGAFTGATAINPVNKKEIPIWISDYVMMSYGTGAIMAVPAHDTRDFEFAQKFQLKIKAIISPKTEEARNSGISPDAAMSGNACWTGNGTLINSANNNGLNINDMAIEEAKQATIEWLEKNRLGKATVNYKLRDWLFSRQRYWGEPFPVVHMEDGEIQLIEEGLPLTLPDIENFLPTGTGESPLAKSNDWLNYTDPKTGKKGQRGNAHHAAVGRFLLVLPAIYRSPQYQWRLGSRKRALLDAGRFVRWRRRTRCSPPFVCKILAQSSVRSRLCEHEGTIHETCQPRYGLGYLLQRR